MRSIPLPRPPLTDGDIRLRPWGRGDVKAVTAACQDPEIPRSSHGRAMDLLLPDSAKWVYVTDSGRHVLLNDDPALATDAVGYLRTGVVPPGGDGEQKQATNGNFG